ncbi:nucleolar zinc-finger protein [Clonorchis sinensis]|uniref:Nucleolar zinc-finger protein n=1 Tax=Clonorchis sinensis TaxID=79923 RepID=A0A3R7FKT8_CLOSI|nr:nucleolar zinc-finger protein [Clonorchis sinensis]
MEKTFDSGNSSALFDLVRSTDQEKAGVSDTICEKTEQKFTPSFVVLNDRLNTLKNSPAGLLQHNRWKIPAGRHQSTIHSRNPVKYRAPGEQSNIHIAEDSKRKQNTSRMKLLDVISNYCSHSSAWSQKKNSPTRNTAALLQQASLGYMSHTPPFPSKYQDSRSAVAPFGAQLPCHEGWDTARTFRNEMAATYDTRGLQNPTECTRDFRNLTVRSEKHGTSLTVFHSLMLANPIHDLKADEQPEITELESLCLNCHENGTTRLLLTRIAYFREVVISSFSCPYCGFENRTIDPASRIQDKGQLITLKVQTTVDLNRRVVRPSGSTVSIPELDASFPTSEGDLSTIEGVLSKIAENIEHWQPERKKAQPEIADKLDAFVGQLRGLLLVERPFTFVLDDPSGNGCIENFLAPESDPQLEICSYTRTKEQDTALGFRSDDADDDAKPQDDSKATDSNPVESVNGRLGVDEVVTFKTNCPDCNAQSDTNMKLVDIPHFKQIVLMATVCPACGRKDSEVKSGGGISALGRRYRLRLTHPSDLSRDVLVSETAGVRIPELDLESMGGTLGGRFTTLEGLLLAIRDQLIGANPFVLGDSASVDEKGGKLSTIIDGLKKIANGEHLGITFEMRDPAGNSYLQNLYAPDPDPELTVEDYERSPAENEDLGLADMNTTDYETLPVDTKSGDVS